MDFRLIPFLYILLFIGVTSVSSKEANITLFANQSSVVLPADHNSGYIHGPTGALSSYSVRIRSSGRPAQISLSLESAAINCSVDQFYLKLSGRVTHSLCVDGALVTGVAKVSYWISVSFVRTALTPNAGKNPAFVLKYYACGGNLEVQGDGSIEAPSTAIVSTISKCSWTVEAKNGVTVTLDLTTLDIEKSANCSKDKLLVRVDDQETRLCDPNVKTKKFRGMSIDIEFSVDKSNKQKRSFKFEYSTCEYNKHISAGKSISIQSDGYPSTLPPNMECLWKLKTDANHTIYVSIEELQLQATSNCVSVFLGFRNIHNPDAKDYKKYCTTLSTKKAYMQPVILPTRIQDLQIYLQGPSNSSAKFKLTATSFEIIQKLNNDAAALSENFTSPTFPGPVPDPLHLRYYINMHRAAVYLEELQLPDRSCKTNALRVSESFVNPFKTSCPNTKPGYLATWKSYFEVDFIAENASAASFKLRFEYELGPWSGWKRISDCNVDCGSGLARFRQTCNATKGGCFLADGRTRAEQMNGFVKCYGRRRSSCKKTKRETWFSVEFTLRFSSSVSSELFNETIGPAIMKSLAIAVTRYCNKNPKICCKETRKAANSKSQYGFLSYTDLRFTSDSPYMGAEHFSSKTFVDPGPVQVRMGVFAVPPKDSALCGAKGAQRRRKREAPTAKDPTEGALSKEVLLKAVQAMEKNELTTAVSDALQKGNSSITVSVQKTFSEVKSVDAPKKPDEPSKPNYFLYIGLPIILILVVGAIFVVGKCICASRKSGGDGSIPMS